MRRPMDSAVATYPISSDGAVREGEAPVNAQTKRLSHALLAQLSHLPAEHPLNEAVDGRT